jgi:hypothetical protein
MVTPLGDGVPAPELDGAVHDETGRATATLVWRGTATYDPWSGEYKNSVTNEMGTVDFSGSDSPAIPQAASASGADAILPTFSSLARTIRRPMPWRIWIPTAR